jgi:hypothetical protein
MKSNGTRWRQYIKEAELEETAKPLAQAAKDSHTVLPNGAHDAIVGGEEGLLATEYLVNPTNPNLHAIEDAPQHLRSLVIASQSDSKKPNILAGTDSLIETNAAIKEELYEAERTAPGLEASTWNPKKKHVEVTSPNDSKALSQDTVKRLFHEPPVTVTGEAVIPAATQNANGQRLTREALVSTSTGPATTGIQVQSSIGEAVVATMMVATVI